MNAREPCPRIEALSALTDDELGAEERVALEAHVAGCAICAPVLSELRQLRTNFALLPPTAADFDVAAEVDRRIGAKPAAAPKRARPLRPRWWQAALLAPGGAIAIGLGLWLGAAAMPATLGTIAAPAAQMAAFSTMPPGAVCPALQGCGGTTR